MDEARTPTPPGTVACPACGAALGPAFLELLAVPVLANAFARDTDSARRAARGDLALAACDRCGLIANRAFVAERVQYDPDYENSQDFSPAFHAFTASLAADLVRRAHLAGRTVLEIGPGAGEFLRLLVAAGVGRAIGYDPAYAGDGFTGAPIEIVAAPFRADAVTPVDYVVCRHVLEHLADPADLLQQLVAGAPAGLGVYLEVPNAAAILDGPLMWDLVYEHHTYFTSEALRALVEAAGFTVTDLRPEFGGQVLAAELQIGARQTGVGVLASPTPELPARAAAFAARFQSVVDEFAQRFADWHRRGTRVAVWGAGSKGITFCTVVPGAASATMFDVNPRKWGRFVPGTAQEVHAPADAATLQPDVVLVGNAHYTAEIRRDLARAGVTPEIIEIAPTDRSTAGGLR